MTDVEGDELIALKNDLLQASNSLMAAFDEIEQGDVSRTAKMSVIDAHECLMRVHEAFRAVANKRLMNSY